MNTIFKNLKNIAILVLIVVIVLMRVFQPESPDMKEYIKIGGTKYELLSKTQDTVYETVHDTILKYVPKIEYVDKVVEVEIPANIDTLAILKDYYTKYKYEDKVAVDKYGFGTISDEVTQNRIVSRSIIWDLKIPIVKETIVVKELPKNQLYIGGGIGFDKINFINQINTGLLWKTKKDKIYGLNLGLANTTLNLGSSQTTLTPYIGVSMYWKIRLGKK